MYVAKINEAKDKASIIDYVQKNGFATLVTQLNGRCVASHIPLYIIEKEEEIYLYGHLARANEQKFNIVNGDECLAIFMATHAYISSSWYDHVNVPTWNYVAVHMYGTPREIKGQELVDSINQLVDFYEQGRKDRFHVDQMTDKSREAHYNGLVAFEIKIRKIEAAEKLSQNRSDHDYYNVTDHLMKADEPSIKTADKMLKIRPKK
jgi:transcriptional regulator